MSILSNFSQIVGICVIRNFIRNPFELVSPKIQVFIEFCPVFPAHLADGRNAEPSNSSIGVSAVARQITAMIISKIP